MQCLTLYLTGNTEYTEFYDIYTSSDGYTTPIHTTVPKQDLIDGYYMTDVPDDAGMFKIQGNGVCTNGSTVLIPTQYYYNLDLLYKTTCIDTGWGPIPASFTVPLEIGKFYGQNPGDFIYEILNTIDPVSGTPQKPSQIYGPYDTCPEVPASAP